MIKKKTDDTQAWQFHDLKTFKVLPAGRDVPQVHSAGMDFRRKANVRFCK